MKNLTLTIALIALAFSLQAQYITRGTEPGEFYLSYYWHVNAQDQMVWAIYRSVDNGESLSLQYSYAEMLGQFIGMEIVSDAKPGVLYGINLRKKLYISHDYAKTWTFVENTGQNGKYFAGSMSGIVYKIRYNVSTDKQELFVSSDFGNSFTMLSSSFKGYLEIGTENNELYSFRGTGTGDCTLYFSNSADLNFQFQSVLDTSIAGYFISGYYTEITRGSNMGELYLVSWHSPVHYRIFYSSNYGQTFDLKYQSEYCNFELWSFLFTAGREPGSFYVVRSMSPHVTPNNHTIAYIDYSSDYGETFTTYFHYLDSSYVFTNINLPVKNSNVSVFPNPFNETVTFSLPATVDNGTITIFNGSGKVVFETNFQLQEPVVNLSHLPTGVYFYKINSKEKFLYSGKVVKY